MRRDLADVRLADRVFAPHYAAPMPRTISAPADLRLSAAAKRRLRSGSARLISTVTAAGERRRQTGRIALRRP